MGSSSVGLGAIYFSTRDAGEQVSAMRGQLKTMSGQLDEMQQEGRPWVSPVGLTLLPKDRNEPLKVRFSYRNFGRQPATFVRSTSAVLAPVWEAGKRIEDFSWWQDPKRPSPRSLCQTTSSPQTVYPSDGGYSFEAGADGENPLRLIDKPIPIESALAAISQRQLLYLFQGCFTYVSAGKRAFTAYCFMLDPRTSSSTDINAWSFLTCPYGNEDGELEQQAEKK
jgi:hypothetical protein